VDRDRLVLGLAAVFAGITVLLVVLAFVRQLFLLFLALPFAATTYFMWHHATGRLEARTRNRARTADRTEPGDATRTAPGGFGAGETGPRRGGRRGRRTTTSAGASGPSRAEAYRALDLDPGADEEAVRRAYRAKVKEVHPDADDGDEEAFKRVNRAYETLTE
jgi:DnaJ-domain-containing protein 1